MDHDTSTVQHAADTVVARHRAIAERALEAATCGRPLCRLDDGPGVSRPKYAEGGLAAVTELQRALRAAPAADPAAVTTDLLHQWEAEREASEERGPAWLAYRTGGVAQLREVLSDLVTAR